MKNSFGFLIVFLFIHSILLVSSCKKETSGGNLILNTIPVSKITYHSAISGVEWTGTADSIKEGGICYSTKPEPTFSDNVSSFDVDKLKLGSASNIWIGELKPNTAYYIRAYLIEYTRSKEITFYGPEIEFTTLEFDRTILFNPDLIYGSVSDVEGNLYKTIKIGTQEWMAENLRTTKLIDNTQIQKITFINEFVNPKVPGYNWSNQDSVNYSSTFGAVYNYYAVNTGKLCPAGWHVPSYDEWGMLFTSVDGMQFAARKLKETGTAHWDDPNQGATNESGFTALPTYRGYLCGWWSTTRVYPESPNVIWFSWIHKESQEVSRGEGRAENENSVRCVKDN
jgi:uncharacterized protein (TIGR02145 family)